eukprot:scaffold1896_cov86-Skeletonema_dohrnii-CCMP3373.AAC.1
MADHADEEDDDGVNIFVYTGGRAPRHVTRVRIDKSVDVIEENAFRDCKHLVQVETHDGIRAVGRCAFYKCKMLRGITLRSVVEIGEHAFCECVNLADVEFGNKLETIGTSAFGGCSSLEHLKLPSVIIIEAGAFWNCSALTDIEFSDRLEAIEAQAFSRCERIERISIPLKSDLFAYDDLFERYNQFDRCDQLTKIDLVGEIHKVVASLHMENWRTEMSTEIDQINQVLPTTPTDEKSDEIQQWMDSVMNKMDQFKAEHYRYVKEAVSVLELALWKAKLDEKEDSCSEGRTKKAKVDAESARREKRITCGADIVIKNVLPFLQLEKDSTQWVTRMPSHRLNRERRRLAMADLRRDVLAWANSSCEGALPILYVQANPWILSPGGASCDDVMCALDDDTNKYNRSIETYHVAAYIAKT